MKNLDVIYYILEKIPEIELFDKELDKKQGIDHTFGCNPFDKKGF